MPLLPKLISCEHVLFFVACVVGEVVDATWFVYYKIRDALNNTFDRLNDKYDSLSSVIPYSRRDLSGMRGYKTLATSSVGFMDLPPEIRMKIYEECLPGPRLIEIRHVRLDDTGGVKSICRVPNLLHICHDSRAFALQTYTLSFGTPTNPPRVFINFTEDTVYFGKRSIFFSLPCYYLSGINPQAWIGPDIARIRKMALKSDFLWRVNRLNLRCFDNLEEIITVQQGHGARLFDLGNNPKLEVKTVADMGFWNHMHRLQSVLIRDFGDAGRDIPVCREGTMIKRPGDKWYVKAEPGRRKDWPF